MSHTLEILVMLSGCLLFGALLYHLATSPRRRRLRDALGEVERLQASQASLSQRLSQTEKDLEQARNDLAAAAAKLAAHPDTGSSPALAETLAALRAQQAALSDQLASVRQELERLGPHAS